jgi:hypothetical protein
MSGRLPAPCAMLGLGPWLPNPQPSSGRVGKIMRRTLASETPRPAAGREDTASDFGHWLTRDLRTKGAITPEPVSTERLRLPDGAVESEAAPEFSRWLLADLRPRNSSLPPVDSLAPQTVHAAPSLPSEPPDAALDAPDLDAPDVGAPDVGAPDLDAQDLAVLPPRRRTVQRYGRHAAVVLLLLGSLGLVARLGFGPARPEVSAPAAEAPGVAAAAALPLPAAEVVEVIDEPDPAALPATPPNRHSTSVTTAAAVSAPELPESLVPRGRRTGSAIARFADLPIPTLSRLAKDERQDTHEHDATVRAAAKHSSVRPATAASSSP